MNRTTLAIALAAGALAVPGVALATGGDDDPATAPVQQQEQQRPDREPCPEGRDRGGDSSGETQL